MELVKYVLKIIIVGYQHTSLPEEFHNFPLLMDGHTLYFIIHSYLTLKLIIWTGIVMSVMAAIDFGFQKWQFVRTSV